MSGLRVRTSSTNHMKKNLTGREGTLSAGASGYLDLLGPLGTDSVHDYSFN